MTDTIQAVAFGIAWGAVAVRVLLHLRGSRTSAGMWLTLAVASIATSLTVGYFPFILFVAEQSGSLWGAAMSLHVAQHVGALAAALAASAFTATATAPGVAYKRIRQRLIALGVAVAAMIVCVLVAVSSPPDEAVPARFLDPEYAAIPAVATYIVVFTSVLAVFLTDVALLCLRHRAPRRATRIGLVLIATGCIASVAYCAVRIAGALTGLLGGTLGGPFPTIAFGLTILTVVLVVTGACTTAVVRASDAIRMARQHRRAYRELDSLWEVVSDEYTRYREPNWGLYTRPRHALTGRMTEIRDAIMRLLPWMPPVAYGEPVQAAAAIRMGLAARTNGEPPDLGHPGDGSGGADLDTEAAALVAISRALTEPTS